MDMARTAPMGAVLASVRFHTVVGCPAVMNALATAVPMAPKPMIVTGVMPMIVRRC
jgi:hypothetical protein